MPRRAPDSTQEMRVTLGTFERSQLEPVLKSAARANTSESVLRYASAFNQVALPLAIAGVGGALALGLVGLGLDGALDRERIRDVILGTPNVRRTRRDGTEQVIENPFFGVPIIGPLFGTGMRIGEKTAEAVTDTINTVDDAISDAVGSVSSEYQDASLRGNVRRARENQRGRSSAGGGPIGTAPAERNPDAADARNRWTSASAGGWSL